MSFVKVLLGGTAPLEAYVALLAALRRIYAALEAAADRCARSCGVVADVCDGRADALRRAPALANDLEHFRRLNPAMVARAEAFAARSAATSDYVAHLDATPDDGPEAEAGVGTGGFN